MTSRKARPSDVADIALALPGVTHEPSWGDKPSFKVAGRAFVIYRGPRKDALDADGHELQDVIVITCSADDKQSLVADDSPFFTTDHFNGYNAVLVRESQLPLLTRDELAEVITDGWLLRAPKKLSKPWLAERGAD
ncbi:MmcQ/YjbR family DNA-binding protein [Nakamurella lactea]|uniref:MmcQ/YjbR family DNA-binding protein n=1 Tax=Nakamurella lactea TaxID=459515 RepID=UPI000491D40B|nr:MmcQ/YjbR family DNA-binding protein [Nakamurella lactea]